MGSRRDNPEHDYIVYYLLPSGIKRFLQSEATPERADQTTEHFNDKKLIKAWYDYYQWCHRSEF